MRSMLGGDNRGRGAHFAKGRVGIIIIGSLWWIMVRFRAKQTKPAGADGYELWHPVSEWCDQPPGKGRRVLLFFG